MIILSTILILIKTGYPKDISLDSLSFCLKRIYTLAIISHICSDIIDDNL